MKKFWASYIFILIPFVILVITKAIMHKPSDILLSTDWSIASFMIVAQSVNVIISSKTEKKYFDTDGVAILIGVVLIFLCLCIGVYAYSLSAPGYISGLAQIFMFVFSSIWLLSAYIAVEKIINKQKKNSL
ncbi:hypothetical protein KUW19_07990 [Ferrimonas balearica]|uniref:hypothetical protein n=1 Tax=Ferrimonas balearica TaxID=44012 RepID=UPI001C94A2D4|nr:hypothetical protein [Ferrimonas balearica]MBY6106425.1 hypothetical protein [Ferrimonas balearica]